MDGSIWPAGVQTTSGLLGVSLELGGIALAQVRGWRSRASRTRTVLLFALSAVVAAVGLSQWVPL